MKALIHSLPAKIKSSPHRPAVFRRQDLRSSITAIAIGGFLLFAAPPPAAAELNDALFARLQKYHYGDDPAALTEVSQRILEVTSHRTADGVKEQLADQLAGLLKLNGSDECKQFVCRQLALIGTPKQVPVLARMLSDDQWSDMARYALAPLKDPSVDQALRAALNQTSGRTQIGIISTLGFRRDSQAVDALGKLLHSTDAELFRATADALGRIGGNSSARLLKRALVKASGPNHVVAADAYLACAEGFLAEGDNARASAIYKELTGTAESDRTRAGALRGLMAADEDAAVPLLLAGLRGESPVLKQTAIGCIRLRHKLESAKRIAAELSQLPVPDAVSVLEALADRQERALVPAVLTATTSPESTLRTAAWQALGKVGDASAAGSLLTAAASSATEEEKNAALAGLRTLRGEGVDDVIINHLLNAPAPARAQLIRVLVDRIAVNAVPALLHAATDSDPSVSQAAFKALGQLAGARDLPAMVRLLPQAQGKGAGAAAEDALVGVTRKTAAKENQADTVLETLQDEKSVRVRCALLRVLGRISDQKALAALQNALRQGTEAERDVAARELAKWPDAAAIEPLENIFQTTDNRTHRVLALRGYLRLLAAAEDRPVPEKMKRYGEVLSQVRSADEKKLVLAGLAEVNDPGALKLIAPLLEDEAARAEASQAALQVAREIYPSNPGDVKLTMERLLNFTTDAERRQQAQAVLRQIEELSDYIVAWQVAGPYFQPGKDYQALFDIEFPPEKSGAQVPWRAIAPGTDPKRPWIVDLLKPLGGEQRVAYLRTSIYSDKPQQARLELGSDDGIKVWLNGKLVHANNVARPLTPASDQVNVALRQGWNSLLLKVTQNNQGWACCARLRKPDGGRIDGLRAAPERLD